MKRMIALIAIGAVALVGGWTCAAVAEPTTDTQGCQIVASKFLQPDAPGHQGIYSAAGQVAGEGLVASVPPEPPSVNDGGIGSTPSTP